MNPPWPLIIVVYRFVVVQWSSVGNQIDIKLVWLWTCTGTGTGFKRFDICALKINKEFDEILHLFPFVVVVVVVVADDVESRGDRSRQTALEIPMMTIVGPMNVVAGTWQLVGKTTTTTTRQIIIITNCEKLKQFQHENVLINN